MAFRNKLETAIETINSERQAQSDDEQKQLEELRAELKQQAGKIDRLEKEFAELKKAKPVQEPKTKEHSNPVSNAKTPQGTPSSPVLPER